MNNDLIKIIKRFYSTRKKFNGEIKIRKKMGKKLI